MKELTRLPEFRIILILTAVWLSMVIIKSVWNVVTIFSDIFLLLILSWLLSFILEPLVRRLTVHGFSRTASAGLVYLWLAVITTVGALIIVPTIVTQLTLLANLLPPLFTAVPTWATGVQTFITNTLSNSVLIAQSLASAFVSLLLILVVSFYFLIEREPISHLILNLIPDEYEKDYKFLENVINTSFANFIRAQLILGILIGIATIIVLIVLRVNYALSASVLAGILAVIPVIGPVLAIIPPLLAAFLISTNTGLIVFALLFLIQQIIYNVIAPKILGEALKIHSLIVLFSFIIGYKIGGAWGAIFAVPVTAAVAVVVKEFIRHWRQA